MLFINKHEANGILKISNTIMKIMSSSLLAVTWTLVNLLDLLELDFYKFKSLTIWCDGFRNLRQSAITVLNYYYIFKLNFSKIFSCVHVSYKTVQSVIRRQKNETLPKSLPPGETASRFLHRSFCRRIRAIRMKIRLRSARTRRKLPSHTINYISVALVSIESTD